MSISRHNFGAEFDTISTTERIIQAYQETRSSSDCNICFLQVACRSGGEMLEAETSTSLHGSPSPNLGLVTAIKEEKMDEKPYLCHFCCRAFTDAEIFTSHMKGHSSPDMVENSEVGMDTLDVKPYLCGVCNKAFTDLNDFLHHKVTLYSEAPRTLTEPDIKPVLCDMCHETFTDMNSLQSHKEHHREDPKKDETDTKPDPRNLCSRGCENSIRFGLLEENNATGINTAVKSETFKSEILPEAPEPYEPRPLEQYIDTFGRIQVQQTMHSHDTYQCEKCEQSFTLEQQLKSHVMTVHNEKNPHKSGNNRNHSGGKLRICDQCGKGFKKGIDMIRHIRTHSGERPFKCDQCEKGFAKRSDLIRHIRTHSGERPFQCDQCEKAFTVKCVLTKHLRTHSGEKPFQCDQCDKTFTQKWALTKHLRIHNGEKPYKCDQCEKAFTRKDHLILHSRIHREREPFQCDQCDKTFKRKGNLAIHLRTHHGEEPENCANLYAGDDNMVADLDAHTR